MFHKCLKECAAITPLAAIRKLRLDPLGLGRFDDCCDCGLADCAGLAAKWASSKPSSQQRVLPNDKIQLSPPRSFLEKEKNRNIGLFPV